MIRKPRFVLEWSEHNGTTVASLRKGSQLVVRLHFPSATATQRDALNQLKAHGHLPERGYSITNDGPKDAIPPFLIRDKRKAKKQAPC